MTQKLSSLNHYSWQANEFGYEFETESGNRISVLFFDSTDQIKIIADGTRFYSLSIENQWKNAHRKVNESDEKTRNTILLILSEFFDKNDGVLLFVVLDSVDGKERARERLFFGTWYKNFGTYVCDMVALPAVDLEGIRIISYLMFPKNFLNKKPVLDAMEAYIQESFG